VQGASDGTWFGQSKNYSFYSYSRGGGVVSELEVVLRLLLATVLSGLVGFEREVTGRVAGFRTHILVCVGSTLIILTGIHMLAQSGAANLDPTRMAGQVVSGIGFLGAGTIIQFKDSVRGLTTAASLWAVAGIGLAVGAGFYLGAVVTTAIVLLVLFVFTRLGRRVGPKARANNKRSNEVDT